MRYYQFKGVLKLVQPFTVNLPNTNHFPVDSVGNPLIPSKSIRGWLRYASYRSILEVLKKEGKLLSIHEHYLLAKGIDTGELVKNERATVIGGNIGIRKVNPMMDLYGRWGLSSALGVGNAIAPISSLMKMANSSRGHIIDSFDDFENYIVEEDQQLLTEIMKQDSDMAPQIQNLRSRLKGLNQEKRNVPNVEMKESLNKKIQEIQEEMQGLKATKIGSKETIRRTNYGVDVIDANTEAQHIMKLTEPYDSSFQFLLWTISKLPLFRIGGGRAFNFGAVEAYWQIYEHTFAQPAGIQVGEVGWKEGEFKFSLIDSLNFDLNRFEESLLDKDLFDFTVFG